MKAQLKKILKRAGVYHRIKSSAIYDLYWRVVDRRIVDDPRREAVFYRETLEGFRPGMVVFDIGANQGYKTDIFLKLGARVVAVDPDETNQAILNEKYRRFRLAPKPVDLVPKAVSDAVAVKTLWVDAPGSAKNTLSTKWVDSLKQDAQRFGRRLEFSSRKEVETTTIEELGRIYGDPFFIKIDVEGYELSVLRGMIKPAPFLSFEVNLPEFRQEALDCIEALTGISEDGEFNYTNDCRCGMALQKWLRARPFLEAFNSCEDDSIEVFWRSPVPSGHETQAAGKRSTRRRAEVLDPEEAI